MKNLQSLVYWSGTAYEAYSPYDSDPAAWIFNTVYGSQNDYGLDAEWYAWAVRPGDVAAAVPEPETYAMLLAGLGLLGAGVKRRRRSFGAS